MTRAGLSLASWQGPAPGEGVFPGGDPVLWLAQGSGASWLAPLKAGLEAAGRLWEPQVRMVAVSDPLPGRSPWAWRPDRELPTRWSEGDPVDQDGLLEHRLADLSGRPATLAGAVLDRVLGPLGSQPARVLCEQTAEVLVEDRPYLLLEANGASMGHVLRGLRGGKRKQGSGPGLVRTVGELRRILELAGLGISRASVLPASGLGGRLAAGALGSAASPWLVVEGRKI